MAIWQNFLCGAAALFGRGKSAKLRKARTGDSADMNYIKDALKHPALLNRHEEALEAIEDGRYFLLESGGAPVGMAAIFRVRVGDDEAFELGAMFVEPAFAGYGVERYLGRIGVATTVVFYPGMRIIVGPRFNNRTSETNLLECGFTPEPWAQKFWQRFCSSCKYRKRADELELPCCSKPMEMKSHDTCRNLKDFLRYRSRITLTRSNGDLLCLELDIPIVREEDPRKRLKEWMDRNCPGQPHEQSSAATRSEHD
jgi:GNAT superfamily N-acetyltransferase